MEKEVLYIREIERLQKELETERCLSFRNQVAQLEEQLAAMDTVLDDANKTLLALRAELAAMTRERDECVTALELLHVVTTACQLDAERWRYYRWKCDAETAYAWTGNASATPEELDAAVDQAMKEQTK